MSSEPFDQPDSGYPEEGPPGAAPDDASDGDESEVRERSRTGARAARQRGRQGDRQPQHLKRAARHPAGRFAF